MKLQKLYNPLIKLVRRNIYMITNVFIAVGVMMVPVGFLLMTTSVSKLWVWAAGIIGFTCIILAIFRADKEDKKNDEKFATLITELKGLREDTKNQKPH